LGLSLEVRGSASGLASSRFPVCSGGGGEWAA
jgi:hypothetical protein